MKTGLKPVLISLAIIIAVLNFYKSLKLFSSPDYPYDARNIYIAGSLWLKGDNPYNDSLLKYEWQSIVISSKIISDKQPGFPACGMIYPFWSIPSLFIYFMLKWNIARVFIWILGFLLLGVILFFASLIFTEYGYKWWQIVLLILCFKSTFTAIALGQPMLFSMAALLGSWYFYKVDKNLLAGLLLGIAYSKISLCIPIILFFGINRNWKILIVSALFPLLCVLTFYLVSGKLYITEMVENIRQQMQINYPGHNITAINTNLSELGILFNYFAGISYDIIGRINTAILACSFLFLSIFYKKQIIDSNKYITLLILCNFMFSYHLIYDCILLLFLLPSVKNRTLALLLSLPMFLPINGIFKDTFWLHFHLPVVIAVLFLYLISENILTLSFEKSN